jgi:hypothetical protein
MHLMQAANDCYSLRTGNAVQQIQHARARTGIEAGYRLIGDNERWTLRQRASDGDALLLSAR